MASAVNIKPNISLPLNGNGLPNRAPLHSLQLIKIGGLIGHFELSNWWFTSFNRAEREHIQSRFKIPGYKDIALTSGTVGGVPHSAVSFLVRMSGLFTKPYHRHIGHRFLDKAELMFDDETRYVEAHYCYDQRIRLSAADHPFDPGAPRRTNLSCEMQVYIAPETASELKRQGDHLPYHRGYFQLVNSTEQRFEYSRTLSLSMQALKQGWAGDWTTRIERCQRRLTDSKSRWI